MGLIPALDFLLWYGTLVDETRLRNLNKGQTTLLAVQADRFRELGFGGGLAGGQGALHLGAHDALAQAVLVLGTLDPLEFQHAIVGRLVEAAIALEGGIGEDGGLEFQIRGAQAHVLGHAQQELFLDHAVQDLGAQGLLIEKIGTVGGPETLPHPHAGLLDPCAEGPLGDFHPVDGGDDRFGAPAHVGIYTPEGKGDGDEDYDRPGDPTLRALSDRLQHDGLIFRTVC